MRTIPEVRAAMLSRAQDFRAAGLNDLADELVLWVADLRHRSPVRRVIRAWQPGEYSAPVPGEISRFAEEHPEMSYMEIATYYGCSIGRVSEALTGFRVDA